MSAYDFNRFADPDLRSLFDAIFDLVNGHDHDGTNSKLVTLGGAPADNSVTNAKLGSDVKVGSLAALTTTIKTSIQAALNEVDSNADAAASAAAAKYTLPGAGIPKSDLAAAVQATLDLADSALQNFNIPGGTPVNAVNATGTLTLSGVAKDGEKVHIGNDDYEFCADTAQSLSAGSDFAVDITGYTTKSQGTLTVDTQPTAGNTMVIGSKTFTFVPNGTANADGEISIGTDLATAQANIIAAINGSDGHNTAHTQVSAAAFGGNASVITALVGGVAGNSIATTETFSAGTNVFDAATLGTTTAGVDCTAPNAVTALVAAITANDTQGVGAVDGAGDTVVLTADTAGVAANAITTTEEMANGSFGAGTLAGGVDGTVGSIRQAMVNASYLYICSAANTIADKNWRRISLGSAY